VILKSKLSHSSCEFMHNLYIAEIFKHRATFLLPIVWINLHSILHSKSRKKLYRLRWCITVIHGHWRSSKFVPIESQYATSYWFSTVTICLSFTVSEKLVKIFVFAVFTHPSLVWNPHKGVVWDLRYETWYQKLESLSYLKVKTAWSYEYLFS